MSNVHEQLSRLTLQERAQLEEQLLQLTQPSNTKQASADPSPRPLSYAQESLWFFDHLVPNSPLYNIPQAFRLRGKLEARALEKAFEALVTRQQALRTRFVIVDGAPRQMPQIRPFRLPCTDLSSLPPAKRDKEAQRLLDEEAKRPFRLAEDLPIRAQLIRLDETLHLLTITLHHIVSDFASLEILHQDLGLLYQAILEQQPPPLPALRVPFVDLAARQRSLAESPALQEDLHYWREQLAGSLPTLELPTDRPRTQARSFNGARRRVQVPAELTSRLREIAQLEGATLSMLLLAAFETLLYRTSGQDDILVGIPIGERSSPEAQPVIGLFLNTVIVRADLSGNPTFLELLRRVKKTTIATCAHHRVPMERLLDELQVPRRPGVNPLCQVLFQYLPSQWPCPRLKGVAAEPLDVETGTAKFELTLTLLDASGGGLAGELEYNTGLFDGATMNRMLGHWCVLLEAVASNPTQGIAQLPLLTNAEREQLLVTWNQTATTYPRHACVHELFEEQAGRAPDAIAVVAGTEAVSYAALNRQANQLAHFLVKAGVRPGSQVGLCLGRSLEMIVGLLAILKAGAAYVPFDPGYPAERLSAMLRDSGVSLLLTTRQLQDLCPFETGLVLLDRERDRIAQEPGESLSIRVTAEDLAYVMFTSGSTGQPKGVAVPHRGVARLVKRTNYARLDAGEVFLQFAPLSFDASTFEIWGPLLNGAKLILYPPEFESLEQFAQVLKQYRVTTLWLTAGLFHQMVEQHLADLATVRQLLAGGDTLSVPHVLKVLENLPNCQLINGYGPTENTTFTCCYHFPLQWTGTSAPIGRPVSNTRVYVLDPHLSPVPIGVAGELWIAGDGLARGYWNSPELTEQKFIRDPFSPESNARLYRTGDRARYLADGTIEFLGRLDDQVKINGFRLHLSEVEMALRELPGISQAVVLARDDPPGSKNLIAYVVPSAGATLSASQLRRAAAEKLPSFMVPTQWVVLDMLPLTPNGKIDWRLLPPPTGPAPDPPGMREPAQNPVESTILQIWREVFGRPMGLEDNFFDLGGHSLIATRVVSRLNQAFQSNIPLATIFQAPTVKALAEKVAGVSQGNAPGPIQRRARRSP